MGRTESAILGEGPVAELARFLRRQRRHAKLTLRQMADRTRVCSFSTLSRAANGRKVPSRAVVVEFVRLCGGGPHEQAEALRLWKQARSRARHRIPTLEPAMPLRDVASPADLVAAMRDARIAAGMPSLRELESQAKKMGLSLARSTLSDALTAPRGPSWRLLEAYVRACGVPDDDLWQWHTAWQRANGRVDTADLDMLAYLAAVLSGSAQMSRPPLRTAATGAKRIVVGAEPRLLIRPLPPQVARHIPTIQIPAPRLADTPASTTRHTSPPPEPQALPPA